MPRLSKKTVEIREGKVMDLFMEKQFGNSFLATCAAQDMLVTFDGMKMAPGRLNDLWRVSLEKLAAKSNVTSVDVPVQPSIPVIPLPVASPTERIENAVPATVIPFKAEPTIVVESAPETMFNNDVLDLMAENDKLQDENRILRMAVMALRKATPTDGVKIFEVNGNVTQAECEAVARVIVGEDLR